MSMIDAMLGMATETPLFGSCDNKPSLVNTRNASRKVLQSAGVDPDRVYQVSGKANSEPLYPDDPTLAGNRRIAIVLLREAPVLPPDHGLQ